MRIGVFTFSTDRDLSPAELAREVEARGLDALLFTEHSHIPTSRTTPYPDVYGGGVLPDFYKRTYDPFVACSFAAAATARIEVGTAICLLALRDAVHAAKEIASIDHLSGGRFAFGVGFGWNEDEFVTHRVPFRHRHAIVAEKVRLMKALWDEEVASFDGEHVQLQPSWSWPKPAQRPSPPVMLGGNGPLTMRHAARWADVWYPTTFEKWDSPAEALAEFRTVVDSVGRDPAEVSVGLAPAAASEKDLCAYRDAGLARVDVIVMGGSRNELLAALDGVAAARDAM